MARSPAVAGVGIVSFVMTTTMRGTAVMGLTPAYVALACICGALHAGISAVAKYDDALVELVAWYFTEGTTGIRPGRKAPTVGIYQSATANLDNCARIRAALTRLFGPASDRLDKGGRYATAETVRRCAQARELRAGGVSVREISERVGVSVVQVGKYLRQDPKTRDNVPRWREIERGAGSEGMVVFKLNAAAAEIIVEHAPGRIVPTSFIDDLTHAQLLLFVETAVRGDGHMMQGRNPVLGQKDPAMLDAFEHACLLLGYATSRTSVKVQGFQEHVQHRITVSTRGAGYRPRANTMSVVNYTGTVWCPTAADTHTMLMRRNGRVAYTGNSAWEIGESEVKFGVVPVVSAIADALTVGLLRPLLDEQNVPDAAEYQVWFDTTELLIRPDRSKDSQALFDKHLVSAAVVRRENGFGDDDAPDEKETERTLLLELLKLRTDLAPKILPALGITLDLGDDGKGGGQGEAAQDEPAATEPAPEAAPEGKKGQAPPPDNSPPTPEWAQ